MNTLQIQDAFEPYYAGREMVEKSSDGDEASGKPSRLPRSAGPQVASRLRAMAELARRRAEEPKAV